MKHYALLAALSFVNLGFGQVDLINKVKDNGSEGSPRDMNGKLLLILKLLLSKIKVLPEHVGLTQPPLLWRVK
jgi:hypothetical protein